LDFTHMQNLLKKEQRFGAFSDSEFWRHSYVILILAFYL
jgi:hypothetical protein